MKSLNIKIKKISMTLGVVFVLSLCILNLPCGDFAKSAFCTLSVHAAVSYENLPDNNSYGDFVVGPGKIEINLDPGESRTIELTVANRLGADKVFTIVEEDFTGSDDPNKTVVLLGDDRGPYSLKDMVRPATTSLMISHGQKARVSVTVSVPLDAEPGGRYGSLIIGTATRPGTGLTAEGAIPTNALVTRIGTLFFVRINGPVKESGRLEKFSIAGNKPLISDSSPLKFDLLFRNDGNVSLNPHGFITVKNMIGTAVGNLEAEPWFALPQSLRFREIEWKRPFLFGRYTAEAVIERGYGKVGAPESDVATVVFWVLPWKVMVSVLVLIVGAIWAGKRVGRGRKRRARR